MLTLYSYDSDPDSTELTNVVRQCVKLIALFPLLAVYSYRSHAHYHLDDSLYIHQPKPELSTAQNILAMLRLDENFTETEARALDLALVLHAEHGGGNNSTFTTHVVTSSGTDTYSAVAASLGSLKGPRHGGANVKVVRMSTICAKIVADTSDDEMIRRTSQSAQPRWLRRSGLIYGMGHAVYSLSDPRADLLRESARRLSAEKGLTDDFALYSKVADIAPRLISQKRRIYKGVSPNVDFYSGMVYRMLGLPDELFTPIFAVARIAGWSAHRIEEIINDEKNHPPAYKAVMPVRKYVRLTKDKSSRLYKTSRIA